MNDEDLEEGWDADDGDDLDDCGMYPDGGVFVCGQIGSEPCEFCPNRRYLGTTASDEES